MIETPRLHRYSDGEFMLSFGESTGPQILVLQPLFEEMNRCRATVMELARSLAARDIGCWIPDLPGTGESLVALESLEWAQWLEATEAAAALILALTGRTPLSLALRGGALVEPANVARHWRLAPTSGRSLLSDLRRSALASGSDPASPAGYRLHEDMVAHLQTCEPEAHSAVRTLRLRSDDRPADCHIDGDPIWRRPEPVTDSALSAAILEDIVAWVAV